MSESGKGNIRKKKRKRSVRIERKEGGRRKGRTREGSDKK